MQGESTEQPVSSSRWRHWPLAVILVVASFLVFTGLARDYLWADEGDTAILARNILKYGVPSAWDGVTFIDSDYGSRLTDDLVMVSSPWLQYYATAISFALAGESTWAARLPFALMGLLTIALVYVLLVRATANRWTAATGAALLMLSVQFLIFSRTSRHYTLNAALTCLLVLQFTRLRSWPDSIRFALVAVLLYHTHPIGLAAVLALGAASLAYAPYRIHWPWLWRAVAMAAPLTLPWLLVARRGYSEATGLLSDLNMLLPRMGQYVVEVASVTSLLGSVLLLALLWRRHRANRPTVRKRRSPQPHRPPLLTPDERGLLVAITAVIVGYAMTMAITQPRDVIWTVGMRYTPAVLPFMAIVVAILVARTSRFQWRPWLALFLVFGFTKMGRLTPWTFWADPSAKRPAEAAVAFHNPERAIDRVFRTGQVAFLESLTSSNVGTLGRVVEYLQQHATRNDVVVTNYSWESLYFHTGLKQGLAVLPSYPIYQAARERGLPDYVFGAEGARWIVWRRAWGAYRGQQLDRLLGQLRERQIPVSLVASIPETLWENRENLHFRRYPGNRYIYPWFGELPDTLIFRVDWPTGAG